jgi:hypothetical protein
MGRAPCCDKANVKKGPWSPEEDATLKAYIEQHGTGGNWIALPQKIGIISFSNSSPFSFCKLKSNQLIFKLVCIFIVSCLVDHQALRDAGRAAALDG